MIINSKLQNNAGFYSMFFFIVNNYIYAKKNNYSFTLDSSDWLFKYSNGWCDYFESINIVRNSSTEIMYVNNSTILEEYPVHEYKSVLNDIYKYNSNTALKIVETKEQLGLRDGDYDSIFIRRGDKLCNESQFIETHVYIEKIIEKNPNCKIIFIQTDDYNCFLDSEKYLKDKGLNIKLLTLCNPESKGMVIFDSITKEDIEKASIQNKFENNSEYISKVLNNLKNEKPVNQMNSTEIYEHTLNMLIGVDIVLKSNICACDYFSNVSRFIKLMHHNYNNVHDVYRSDNELNLNTMKSPSFLCSFYPGL